MLVSVVIPAYNVESCISECLNSVLSQSYKDIEIICIDDCSQDSTLSILESHKKKHPQILVLMNEKNMGASFSRNKGLEISKGEYIQFLDADDELLPDKIIHQTNIIRNQKQSPDIIAGACIINQNKKKIISSSFSNNPWIDLIKGSFGSTCSNLWRKEPIINIGGWDVNARSSQDTDLIFRLLQKSASVVYDTVPLTVINKRESGSISKNDPSGNCLRYIYQRAEIYNFLSSKKMLSGEIRTSYYNNIFNSLRLLFRYDAGMAAEQFKRFIPSDIFSSGYVKISFSYRILYSLFGFVAAEKIFNLFSSNK